MLACRANWLDAILGSSSSSHWSSLELALLVSPCKKASCLISSGSMYSFRDAFGSPDQTEGVDLPKEVKHILFDHSNAFSYVL